MIYYIQPNILYLQTRRLCLAKYNTFQKTKQFLLWWNLSLSGQVNNIQWSKNKRIVQILHQQRRYLQNSEYLKCQKENTSISVSCWLRAKHPNTSRFCRKMSETRLEERDGKRVFSESSNLTLSVLQEECLFFCQWSL